MLPGFDIAPLRSDERSDLFMLAHEAFGAVTGWSDRRALGTLEQDVVFVAHVRTVPAGYVALREELPAMVIEQLVVAPYHEEEIGERLLAHAEGFAISQRAACVRAVVERDNASARAFYRRSGFAPVADELFERVLPLS